MTDGLKCGLAAEVKRQVAELVDANITALIAAMGTSLMEHEGNSPFVYRIGMGVQLRPRGDEVDVASEMKWSLNHRAQCETATVYDGPGLFDGDDDDGDVKTV